jgi:hypothetical protein
MNSVLRALPPCRHLQKSDRDGEGESRSSDQCSAQRSVELKGLTLMVSSIYNGQRFEDLWLDR